MQHTHSESDEHEKEDCKNEKNEETNFNYS